MLCIYQLKELYMNKLVQRSFFNALGVSVYIAAVATVIRNGEKVFGQMDNVLGPITFLLLFVISAAITGSLVIGKPVLMYLDGAKREAVRLFLYTVGWLAVGMIVLLGVAIGLR